MKTLILYYTLGGTSKAKAEELAASQQDAVLCEVKEIKKRSIITAFIPGCPQAMHRKKSAIQPIEQDLSAFDKIQLIAPIWAGHPAPAFNAALALVPSGKEVEIFLCSGGGDSEKSKSGTIQLVEEKGCKMVRYHDLQPEKK